MDIETIGIALDTSSLERGNKALDETAAKADKASVAADRLSDSNKTVSWQNQQMAQTSKQVSASLEDQSSRAQKLADQMYKDAQAADAFMTKLKKLAEQAGLSSTEILKQQAAMHGVSEGAADYISKIESAEAATHKLSLANSGVIRELSTLGGEALRGNWTRLEGSMTVLANRTGATQAALSALQSPLGALVAVSLVAATAVAFLAAKQEELDRTMNLIQARMDATGHSAMFTSDQIMAMAKSMQLAGGESRSDAIAGLDALSKFHDVGKQLYQDLTTVAVDYSFISGKKLPDAMKELGTAFESPFEGARKLDAEFGMLTSSEVLALEKAKNINDTAAAQTILFEALRRTVSGLHETGFTPLQQATHDLHLKWDELTTSVAAQDGLRRAVGFFTTMVTLVTDLLDKMEKLDSKMSGSKWALLIPGGGLPMYLAGNKPSSQQSASGPVAQAAASSSGAADEDTKKIDDYIKKTLEANATYVSQAGNIAILTEKRKELTNAITLATQEYGAESPQVQKLNDELVGLNETMGRKGADALNAQIEALKRFGMAQDEQVKQVIQHTQSLQRQSQLTEEQAINAETAALLSGLGVKEQVLQKELEVAKKKTQSQAEVARISGELDNVQIQRNGVLITQQDRLAEAQKKQDDNQKKAYDTEMKSQDDTIRKVNEQSDAIQMELDHHEKNKKAIEEVAIARLEEQKAILSGFDASDAKVQKLQNEIDARKKLVGLLDQKTAQDASDAAAKKAEESWTSTSKRIEEGLYSSITKGGSNGFKKLMDDVKNWFAHLILQPIIQPLSQFGASLLNSGAASAQGNGMNLFSGGFSLNSMGSFESGGAGFFGQMGSLFGVGSGSAAVGSSAPSVFNAAMDSQAANQALGLSSSVGTSTIASAIPYAGAVLAASQKQYGAAAGMAIGTAIMPGIGTAIGAVVGTIVDSFSKSHGPKTESAYGAGVPTRYTGNASGATSIAQTLQQQYSSYATAAGVTGNTNLNNLGVFYSQDPNGTAMTQLDIHGGNYSRAALNGGRIENVGRDAASFQQAVALASAQLIIKNLQDAASGKIGDYLRTFNLTASSLDTLQQALQVVKDVGTLDNVLNGMGESVRSLRDASVTATESFINNMGGLENATSKLNSYYNNFLTGDEKRQAAAKQIASTLNGVGLGVSSDQILGMSRDQYRALVEASSADPGGKLYSALISVNDVFASLTPAAQGASDALGGVTGSLSDVGKSLWEYVRSLGIDRSGTASPMDQLSSAKMAYTQDLSLAQGGNYDAYQRLQNDSQAYIDAGKLNYSSGTDTQKIIDQVISDIGSLSPVQSYNQQMLAATTSGSSQIVNAVTSQTSILQGQLQNLLSQIKTLVAESQAQTQLEAAHVQITSNGNDSIVNALANQGLVVFGAPTAESTGVLQWDPPGG